MSILRKLEPRKRMTDVKSTAPFVHGLDDVFEDLQPRRWMEAFDPSTWRWPMGVDFDKSFRMDVIDREEELVVRGELPGVEKDDIEVTIMGGRLMIEAERKFEEEEKKDAFYRHEFSYGKMERAIPLPVEVEAEHIKAELKDGILEVRLPKAHVQERQTIKVT